MKNFESLTKTDRDLLIKYPAYVALLAVSKDERLDTGEKNAAEKFLHLKNYSCDPLLAGFYAEADKQFEKNISELDRDLPSSRSEREIIIRRALSGIEAILKKLEPEYASLLYASMKSFKEHVSKSHFNVLEYFIFPLPVNGITE